MSERIEAIHYLDQLVEYHTNTKCIEVTDTGIKTIDGEGKEDIIEADTVVMAMGMKARIETRDSFQGVAFDVIPVGDCVQAGTLVRATHTGYNAALRL